MPEPEPIALLKQLIAINSVNSDLVTGGAGEAGIAAWCAAWLREHGFDVHVLEERSGRPSVVGIVRGSGGGRSLMLNGHLDTVGIATYGSAEPDDHDAELAAPFAAVEADGAIYGRGAFDMKGGLAAILVAASRAAASGLAGDVLVALVADEEFGSLGTEEVLRNFTADAAIVAEPSQLELVVAHRGFAWFELELTGRAAHGSMPEQGVDAIAHAALVLSALNDLRARVEARHRHPLLGFGTVRVSRISGGADAATVAPSCSLTIERRTLPGESPDGTEAELRAMLDQLAATVPDFQYTLRRTVARGAFEADPEWPIVQAVSANAERVFGQPAARRGEPFWTDAGLIQEAGIPCLLIGVAGGGAHADVEWVTVASVLQLTDVLEGTIRDFCG